MGRPEVFTKINPDRLHQLSAELLQLAATLGSAEEQPRDRASIRERNISASEVRALIRTRRLRGRLLGQDLFADPAWDIILDLFAARLEGGRVSVSSSCIAANVPTTTALRWIKALEEKQLVVRRQDANDGRRCFLALSEDAAARVAETLCATRGICGLPL